MPARRRATAVAFVRDEARSAGLLAAAALAAVALANSPLADARARLLATRAGPLDLHGWVVDGLMALFFLVVGLELKREVLDGELRDPRAAALPALAAAAGMAVPAGLFLVLAPAGARHAWGTPMATDVAFALGLVAVAGRRLPDGVRLFLLALAVVDDLGAVVVLAVAYSHGVEVAWLLGALAAAAGVAVLRGRWPAVVVLGPAAWWCLHEGGVHPTLAGVLVALAVPVHRGERYERALHPWSAGLVVPLFALAAAGVRLDGDALRPAGAGRTALAVAIGLVAGKALGVGGATWLGVRLRVGALPAGRALRHVPGAAAAAGIGFTVALFVAGVALPARPELAAAATIGILAGSLAAAALGGALLHVAGRGAGAPKGPG